jgi:cobaltochelatase CobN
MQGELEELVDSGNPVLMPLSRYQKWFDQKLSPSNRQTVINAFGPPPGRIMVVQPNGEPCIVIPRINLGNVVLPPQPERGETMDEKLLHSRDVPPPDNDIAFYWWLQQEEKSDALVLWGTHGSLELLPGKEAGLARDCWGDVGFGDMPVVNPRIMDNLAEVDRFLEILISTVDGSTTRNTMTLVPVGTTKNYENILNKYEKNEILSYHRRRYYEHAAHDGAGKTPQPP